MRFVRTLAPPLLAGGFIAGGMDVLAHPGARVKLAKPVGDRVAARLRCAHSDPKPAVALSAAIQIGGGSMLAAGILSRLAAPALGPTLVPTTPPPPPLL